MKVMQKINLLLVLPTLLLSACDAPTSEVTSVRAREIADRHIDEIMGMDGGKLHVRVTDQGPVWEIAYSGGPGGSGLVRVNVQKTDGQASIVEVQQ